MDPISTVASCVSALQKVYDVRKQLKGNYEDCGRLLDRCELFKPNLDKIQSTPSLYDLSCEPQFATLLATLNDTVEFARQFLEPTLIQRATRFLFRNTRAAEISALTVRINSCLQDLNFAFQGHMMRDVRDVKVNSDLTRIHFANRSHEQELISGKGAFGVVSTGPPSPSSPNEAGFQTDIEKTDGAHVRQQNINEVQSIETNNRLSIAAVVPKLLSQVAVVSEHSNTSALQDSDVNVLYRIRPQGRMASVRPICLLVCGTHLLSAEHDCIDDCLPSGQCRTCESSAFGSSHSYQFSR